MRQEADVNGNDVHAVGLPEGVEPALGNDVVLRVDLQREKGGAGVSTRNAVLLEKPTGTRPSLKVDDTNGTGVVQPLDFKDGCRVREDAKPS